MTAINLPAAYDVSHYVTIADFTAIKPRPLLMGTKATEGISYVDPTFAVYMAGMRQIGCARIAYHFHRRGYNASAQARHFVETVSPHIDDATFLALDMEEGGESAAQIIAWIQYVMSVLPRNQVILYSRKNLLDPIAMTTAQKMFMRSIPVWVAGYPLHPEDYISVPWYYIPDPDKYGPVWLWQYADNGIVEGISGKVDLNWIAQPLLDIIGGGQPPQEEPMDYVKGAVNASAGLNVRAAPDVNAAKLGALPYQTPVEGWLENSWIRIDYNGQPGYVLAQYVTYVTATPPTTEGDVAIDMTLHADGSITGTWKNA